ncbi:MAG: hypothetical protein IJC88_06420 [Oscillospiraceae bacterium]|nr:hypothetical protein [Oscillospiraceae bacterium]
MTGIDKICERISLQADEVCREILSRAEEEVQAVRAECSRTAAEESEAIVTRGKAQATEREARLSGVAELEAKKLHLKTKQSMIDAAFEEALSMLCAFSDERRTALLASLAANGAVSGAERVIFTKADRDTVGAAVISEANKKLGARGKLTLAEETTEAKGGVILAEGNLEINCTFETILRQMHDDLSGEVAEILFQ